jgi:hypothetical protein
MRWFISFSLLLSLVCGCGSGYRDQEISDKKFDQAALKMIEGKIGFPLPPGTKGIRMLKWEAIDPGFLAILTIPKVGQESITQELAKKPEIKFSVTNYATANLPWWKPEEKKTIVLRSYMKKNELIKVRLCSDAEALMMYVECSLAM